MSILKLKAIIRLISTKEFLLITIPKEGETTQFYRVRAWHLQRLRRSVSSFGKMIDKELGNEL